MQFDDGGSGSSSISSPPGSPQFADTIHVARNMTPRMHLLGVGASASNSGGSAQQQSSQHADPTLVGPGSVSGPASNAAAAGSALIHTATPSANGTSSASAVEKPKRQRKKKEVGPDGKPIEDAKSKPKAPRKPREPKAPGTTTTARKKKTDANAALPKLPAPSDPIATSASRQPTITEMVSAFPAPAPPSAQPGSTLPPSTTPRPLPTPAPAPAPIDTAPRVNSVPPTSSTLSSARPPLSTPTYEPTRSYDPVRGVYTETRPASAASTPTVHHPAASQAPAVPPPPAKPPVNHASASASIAGLIDPPTLQRPSYSPKPSPQHHNFNPTLSQSPPQYRPTSTTSILPSSKPIVANDTSSRPIKTINDDKMDIDMACENPAPQVEVKAPSKSSSSAPTPKVAPSRPSPPPAPKGTGSGLLSSSDLFGGSSKEAAVERDGVNIDIEIKLNPLGGNTVNIAQEIARKYGRDAINPRAAAHRARLLQVAAAANKIDGGAGDDMSVDLMSELDGDSNVEMGGMDDEKSGADTTDAKPKKRKRKGEDYDKEDDFIDDTELAWQEQAAVAKDGFFVYSGPLVPVGQDAQVETSQPTRGRGRGRGSRGGRGAASSTTHSSVAEKKERDPSLPLRGRGSRGGRMGPTGGTRKPRITKAEKEKMDQEKLERERASANLGGPAGAALPMPPTATTSAAPSTTNQAIFLNPSPLQQQHALGTTA